MSDYSIFNSINNTQNFFGIVLYVPTKKLTWDFYIKFLMYNLAGMKKVFISRFIIISSLNTLDSKVYLQMTPTVNSLFSQGFKVCKR